jgi:hypothetical protein
MLRAELRQIGGFHLEEFRHLAFSSPVEPVTASAVLTIGDFACFSNVVLLRATYVDHQPQQYDDA